PILIGSLFHDALEGAKDNPLEAYVSAEKVGCWLKKIEELAPIDPVQEEARLLAELYFKLRSDSLSQSTYGAIRQIKLTGRPDSIEGLPAAPLAFPWIGSWNERGKDQGDRRVRLAILFLMIRAHIETRRPQTREYGRSEGMEALNPREDEEKLRKLV